MMTMPLFSIIIPTLDAGETLGKAMDSIFNQTFREFEILVIDGNSNDNTLLVAKQHEDGRTRAFSEADGGIYEAMNKGIGMARGDWLYFMGSDDILYDNDVLHDIKEFIAEQPDVDFVYGNVFSSHLGPDYDGIFDLSKLLQRNICHQAIFYRRSIFDKSGLYNTDYAYCADHDVNLRCFYDASIKKSHISRRIALYHSGGVSAQLYNFYNPPVGEKNSGSIQVGRQAIKERYLMLNTLKTLGMNQDYLETALEKQAKRLVRIVGVRNALFRRTYGMIREFSIYDPYLQNRISRLIWTKVRRYLSK